MTTPISPPAQKARESLVARLLDLYQIVLNKAHTQGQDDYREGATHRSVMRHGAEFDLANTNFKNALEAALTSPVAEAEVESELRDALVNLVEEMAERDPTDEDLDCMIKARRALTAPHAPSDSADKARLDWLENEFAFVRLESEDEASVPYWVVYAPEGRDGKYAELARGITPREALDSAMQSAPKPPCSGTEEKL